MIMFTRTKLAIAAAVLGVSLVSATAFAGGSDAQGKEHASFPMPAAQFKAKVDARMQKARAHMEERVSKLPANEAQAERARFDQKVAAVNAEVAKATADGTVTKEEARAVRAVSPHGNRGECKGKEKGKS
jgi:hypothetical protein